MVGMSVRFDLRPEYEDRWDKDGRLYAKPLILYTWLTDWYAK